MAAPAPAPAPPSDHLFIRGLPLELDDTKLHEIFTQYGQVQTCKMMAAVPGAASRAAMVRMGTQDEATWLVENLSGGIPQGLAVAVEVKYAHPTGAKGDKGKSKGYGKSYGKSYDHGKSYDQPSWGALPCGNGGKGDWGKQSYAPYSKGKDAGFVDKGKGKGKECGIRSAIKGLYASGLIPGGGTSYTNDEKTLFVSGLPPDTTDAHLYQLLAPFGAVAPNGMRAMLDPLTRACKGFGFCNYTEVVSAQAAVISLHGFQLADGTVLRVEIKKEEPKLDDGKGKGKLMLGA